MSFDIKKLVAGITTGTTLIGGELLVFATTAVLGAVENAVPSSSASTVSVTATMQFVFVALDLIQNLGFGFLAPIEFAFGFLIGDLGMLIVAGPSLWDTLPSVVLAMVVAFLIVLFALIIRITTEEGQTDTTIW